LPGFELVPALWEVYTLIRIQTVRSIELKCFPLVIANLYFKQMTYHSAWIWLLSLFKLRVAELGPMRGHLVIRHSSRLPDDWCKAKVPS